MTTDTPPFTERLSGAILYGGTVGIAGLVSAAVASEQKQAAADAAAEQRLRALVGLASHDPTATADMAVGDADARWNAHVEFMRTTPYPVRRRRADFLNDVAAEAIAGTWGP